MLHINVNSCLGLDVDNSSSPYGASIPIEKAADPRGDVLLGIDTQLSLTLLFSYIPICRSGSALSETSWIRKNKYLN